MSVSTYAETTIKIRRNNRPRLLKWNSRINIPQIKGNELKKIEAPQKLKLQRAKSSFILGSFVDFPLFLVLNLLNKVCDRACNSKYRPKVKPTVIGFTKSSNTS